MKLAPQKRETISSATITQTLGLILVCSTLFIVTAYAADPAWWSSPGTGTQSAVNAQQVVTNGGVVTTNYITNEYAVINQGQLKQFTTRAVDELNAHLPGGASPALTNLVYGWQQDYLTNGYSASNIKPSDYQAVNVGQLKYIGNLVWTQLTNAGYTNTLPSWLATSNAADLNAANIGQLKTVFNFDLSGMGGPTVPDPVTNLTASNSNPGEIDLTWTLPTTDTATSILIERSTDGSNWTTVATLNDPTATTYADPTVTPGQSYTYRATNKNNAGSGTPTTSPAPVQAVPPISPTPSGLTGFVDVNGYMNLSWTASTGATSYLVERETLATDSWTTLATPSGTTYQDTTHGSGGYHYRVSAINAGGTSAASREFPVNRYAAINLLPPTGFPGIGLDSAKVTASGNVLLYSRGGVPTSSSVPVAARWMAGTGNLDIIGAPEGYNPIQYFDMNDSGTLISSVSSIESLDNHQLATWNAGSTTPTLTPSPFSSGPLDLFGDIFFITSWNNAEAINDSGTLWTYQIVDAENDTTIVKNNIGQYVSVPTGEYEVVYDSFINGTQIGTAALHPVLTPVYSDSTPPAFVGNAVNWVASGTTVSVSAANNAGDTINTKNEISTHSSQIYFNGISLDFAPTSLSQQDATGKARVIGVKSDFSSGPLPVWWDGTTHTDLTDASTFTGINAATTIVGGVIKPAVQMIGQSKTSAAIWTMDPTTGTFGHAEDFSDLGLSFFSPWAISDNGAIVGAILSQPVMLVPVQITKVISNQFTGLEFNELPTGLPYSDPVKRAAHLVSDYNNPLIMACNSGTTANLSLAISGIPASLVSKFLVGVRQAGATTILASTPVQLDPTRTLLQFPANNGAQKYQVVIGYDANGNGLLDPNEASLVYAGTGGTDPTSNQDKVYVTTLNDYTSAVSYLEDYTTDTISGTIKAALYPNAAALTKTFLDSTTAPLCSSQTTFTLYSNDPDLKHPLGANWTANGSAGSATANFYTYNSSTSLCTDVATSNSIKSIILGQIAAQKATVLAYFSANPTATSYTSSNISYSSPNFSFSTLDPRSDAFYSLGSVDTLQGHFQFTASKSTILGATTINVTALSFDGTLSDPFDFYFLSSQALLHNGAMVQAGYPALGTSGRVFDSYVTFSVPTSSYTYQFQ